MTNSVSVRSTLVLAAGALALAAPAAARTVDSWEVNTGVRSCMMLSTYEDDVSVGLVAGRDGSLAFMVSGAGLAKLARAGDKVTLGLTFAGKMPHTEWTDEAAKVVAMDEGHVAVLADWGPSLVKELGDTVTASPSVTVHLGGTLVGTYDLAGSPVAYRELSHCGKSLAAK